MNKVLIRSLCVLVLVSSIAVRVQANQIRSAMLADFDISAAVAAVVRENGYALRENPVKPPKLLGEAVYFQRPECDQPSFALPFLLNAETMPMLTRLNRPDYGRRYFYMDRSWDEQNRVAMVLQWMKYNVLDLFGASPYVPYKKALLLAEPPGCSSAAAIDWRPVWDKERFRKAPHNGAAAQRAGA